MYITSIRLDQTEFSYDRPPINHIKKALDLEDTSRTEGEALWSLYNGYLIVQADIIPNFKDIPEAVSARTWSLEPSEIRAKEYFTCLFEAAMSPASGESRNKIPIPPTRAPWWLAHRLKGAEVLEMSCNKIPNAPTGLYRATGQIKVEDPDLWFLTKKTGVGRRKSKGFGLIFNPRIAPTIR